MCHIRHMKICLQDKFVEHHLLSQRVTVFIILADNFLITIHPNCENDTPTRIHESFLFPHPLEGGSKIRGVPFAPISIYERLSSFLFHIFMEEYLCFTAGDSLGYTQK